MNRDYDKCIEELINIPMIGKKSGLDNIKVLLEGLNNPHKKLKYIHVAGTNGKGSVCSMLASILLESNLKVGLFTSPHLVKINERIRVNSEDISDENFAKIYNKVKEAIDNMVAKGLNHPTFFEILLAMSLEYFLQQQVDIVILETGLGGRLDSTNIIENPLVTVITKIGHDHNEILGNTIEEIANEKAGIIKEGCDTVLLNDNNAVENVVISKCREKKSNIHLVLPYEYEIIKRSDKTIDFSINNQYYYYKGLKINSCANYQLDNVAITLTTIYTLKNHYIIEYEHIKNGLNNFKWPGRMELVNDALLIDGAHNVDGIKEFVKNIISNFSNRSINILFTCMKEKNYSQMIEELAKCTNINKVIITKLDNPRNEDIDILYEEFLKNGFNKVEKHPNFASAFIQNYKLDSSELLASVGSLYLVAEVKKILQEGF